MTMNAKLNKFGGKFEQRGSLEIIHHRTHIMLCVEVGFGITCTSRPPGRVASFYSHHLVL